MTHRFVLFAIFTFLIAACSQVSYKPEAPDHDDTGVIFEGDTLVYSIPATNPVDKMKLSFRGIKDGNLMHLHLRFIRKGAFDPVNPETLDPKELVVQIEGQGPKLAPLKIYAPKKGQPNVQLVAEPRQAVELVYQLPIKPGETPRFEFFTFHWRVQYAKGKFVQQTVRFDRQQAKSNNSNVSYTDPDFIQYDEFDDSGWYPSDWAWW